MNDSTMANTNAKVVVPISILTETGISKQRRVVLWVAEQRLDRGPLRSEKNLASSDISDAKVPHGSSDNGFR
jgi:hypothetical protein